MAADNPFLAMQENASRQIVAALDAWRDMQRGAGRADVPGGLRLAGAAGRGRHRSCRDAARCARRPRARCISELLQKRIAELKSRIPVGGLREAVVRGAALCRHGAGRGRRARVRGRAPHSRGARRPAAVGVQGAGARAVQHAADRPGGGARRNSVDASGRCRTRGSRRSI